MVFTFRCLARVRRPRSARDSCFSRSWRHHRTSPGLAEIGLPLSVSSLVLRLLSTSGLAGRNDSDAIALPGSHSNSTTTAWVHPCAPNWPLPPSLDLWPRAQLGQLPSCSPGVSAVGTRLSRPLRGLERTAIAGSIDAPGSTPKRAARACICRTLRRRGRPAPRDDTLAADLGQICLSETVLLDQ